jgi:hypothetical protein
MKRVDSSRRGGEATAVAHDKVPLGVAMDRIAKLSA